MSRLFLSDNISQSGTESLSSYSSSLMSHSLGLLMLIVDKHATRSYFFFLKRSSFLLAALVVYTRGLWGVTLDTI